MSDLTRRRLCGPQFPIFISLGRSFRIANAELFQSIVCNIQLLLQDEIHIDFKLTHFRPTIFRMSSKNSLACYSGSS